jgi:hypothetical protein
MINIETASVSSGLLAFSCYIEVRNNISGLCRQRSPFTADDDSVRARGYRRESRFTLHRKTTNIDNTDGQDTLRC